MNCLEDNQIILYLTRFGLNKDERSAVEKHLYGCKQCRNKKDKIERTMKDSEEQNKRECELVRNNMAAYITGEIKQVAGVDFEQHLNECETCSFIYSRNKKQLTFEEMEALNIPVPDDLLSNILTAVTEAIPREGTSEFLPELSLSEAIGRGIEKAVNYIQILLQPLELKPAFRGKALFHAKRLNHNGGDLVLDLGEPNVTVRIFSLDDVELGEQQSDSQGRAIFKDFEKAEYKIDVEGHEIRDIQYIEK